MHRHSPSSSSRYSTKSNTSSGNSGRSRRSNESQSTAATTPQSSPRSSPAKTFQDAKTYQERKWAYQYDALPSTSYCDRASTETFDSELASEDDEEEVEEYTYDESQQIPPLGDYIRDIVEPSVRPSNPEQFARLFPSTERLSIRHDEFTADGNMNLRVDMVAPGRRRAVFQLFHLRMHDLAKRKFSLRRYYRESGREVCNSERKYEGVKSLVPASTSRPNLQRSVSTAFKFRRTNSGGPLFGSKSSHGSSHGSSSSRRPGSSSSAEADCEYFDGHHHGGASSGKKVATNTIKLEFSNYARVDITRKGRDSSKRYDFEWWGHKYSWKRVFDKDLHTYSFHLVRDGSAKSVAHIVPESRSPMQQSVEDLAGGWVPPCHMWISDESLIKVATDVADVVIATGLMALVDNCIKEKWQVKKAHRISVPLTSKTLEFDHRKAFKPALVHHAHTDHHASSPLRYANPISAY